MQMSYETVTLASREIALPGVRVARTEARAPESSTSLQRIYPWIFERAELKHGETGEEIAWLVVAACSAVAVGFSLVL